MEEVRGGGGIRMLTSFKDQLTGPTMMKLPFS